MDVSGKKSVGWFHCSYCGEMFRARMGEREIRRCDACGRDPGPSSWQVNTSPAQAVLPQPRAKKPALPGEFETTKVQRRRKKKTLSIFIVLWIGFMGLLVFLGNHFWRDPVESAGTDAEQRSSSALTYLDQKLLNDNLPAIYQTFTAHVVAANDAQRAQTVLDPTRVAPAMTRFFALNPLIRPDIPSLTPKSNIVLRLPEGDAVEILWVGKHGDYDTAFIRQDGEWRLDWEHFVRYSEYPLSLFLAGNGPDEAEFRLFARERLAVERRNEPTMSIVLYSTMAGKLRDAGVQTPQMLVPRHGKMGQRLTAAFQMARIGKRPFDSQLEVEEPDDLIRVRVRIRRNQVDGVRSYEITDLPACHWYGLTNAPGVPEVAQERVEDAETVE